MTEEEKQLFQDQEKGNNIIVLAVCLIAVIIIGLSWSLALYMDRLQDSKTLRQKAESDLDYAMKLNNLTLDYLDECVTGYKELSDKFKILHNQEFFNIENCTDIRIYSELGSDEECINQYMDKNFTEYDSIINMCEQEMIVYCGKNDI